MNKRFLLSVLLLCCLSSCGTTVENDMNRPNIMETEKRNIGSLLALYPKPMTVVGAEVGAR